jgi:hypothetical protein
MFKVQSRTKTFLALLTLNFEPGTLNVFYTLLHSVFAISATDSAVGTV